MSKRVLVIGFGNPLRGDDALGWQVAQRLKAGLADRRIAIMAVHQLTPELAEPIHRADMVIFVDASSEGKPGAWRCSGIERASKPVSSLGHHLDVAGLLAYTQALYQSCPKAWVVSVTAGSFDCGDGLSPKVETALPGVVRHIRDQIEVFGSKK